MFDDFDFDFDAIPKSLIKKTAKEAIELADIYASEANHNKLRNALEKKCRNASSDAERRVYKKMLQEL
jgi:hypothetical protein